MARELRRLWIPPERLASPLLLTPEESHYLSRVLRLRPGERLAVIDGVGGLWSATLDPPHALHLEQPLAQPLERAEPPRRRLTLALAVPKRETELVWRMAVELGATHLQPLIAQRGVVRQGLPLQRWRSIVKEATEQCERLWLPELAEPQSSERWFETPRSGLALLACPRQANLVTLAGAGQGDGGPEEVCLAIGPEGGWSPQEESMALAAGWQSVQLGEAILRTSTAAVAALALLSLSSSQRSGPLP